MLLLLAAALPALIWDRPATETEKLKAAHVNEIAVAAGEVESWRKLGFGAEPVPSSCEKLAAPKINYRVNVASATRSPWIDANGWRYLRRPAATYCVEADAASAGITAAEAFAYGARAFVHALSDESVAAFAKMTGFLRELAVNTPAMQSLANIEVVDDGTQQTGELLNLLSRRNLLFRTVQQPNGKADLTVSRGAAKFPAALWSNPYELAYRVREELTDEKRLLRVYGSEVVIGHLTGNGSNARLHLLNYARRPVLGLRVRVLGQYEKPVIKAFGMPDAQVLDVKAASAAIEFTVEKMNEYAVIDLSRVRP